MPLGIWHIITSAILLVPISLNNTWKRNPWPISLSEAVRMILEFSISVPICSLQAAS